MSILWLELKNAKSNTQKSTSRFFEVLCFQAWARRFELPTFWSVDVEMPCFLMSFLMYVPTACLTAMTFPAILYATDHVVSGALGFAVAVLLSLKKKSLIVVAVAGCVTVFIADLLIGLL